MKRLFLIPAVFGLLFGLAGQANATLIGDEVILHAVFVNDSTLNPVFDCVLCVPFNDTRVVIEGSREYLGASHVSNLASWDIDVEAASILWITFFQNTLAGGFYNGWRVSDLDWVGTPGIITGFTLDTNISGYTESLISFGDDFVQWDVAGFTVAVGDYILIDLITDHVSTSVPEPGTLGLLAAGLFGVGFIRRKRIA